MQTRTSAGIRAPFTRATERIRIFVAEGPDRGAIHLVATGLVRVGTADDAEITLTDPAVSRLHAELRWDRAGLSVVDRGSKNGTFVDGCRIRDAVVPIGGRLRLGATTMQIVPDDEVVDPNPAASGRSGALVATSPVMRKLFTLIDQLAANSVPVLIEGETGVGKNLIAEQIHRRSPRAAAPCIAFDCGSLEDAVVASTLFGHVRGAFDGADSDRDGVFAAAHGGTVVLDEIGELASEHQPALLRVFDRGLVRPVGSPHQRTVDVRAIATTSHDLERLMAEGRFRDDLFYRLAVVRIAVPPLRDRREDIAPLVRHFLEGTNHEIDDRALARLATRTWPGNVRELENSIAAAVACTPPGSALELEHTLELAAPAQPDSPLTAFRHAKASVVETFERDYLKRLMAAAPTLAAAAAAAEMDRKHLRELLRRYGLRDQE